MLALATIANGLLFAFFFYLLERHAPGTEVRTYGDALFWTGSQITTISSSLANPISTGGRILAVGLDFVSISVVSLLFAVIADHLQAKPPRAKHR